MFCKCLADCHPTHASRKLSTALPLTTVCVQCFPGNTGADQLLRYTDLADDAAVAWLMHAPWAHIRDMRYGV